MSVEELIIAIQKAVNNKVKGIPGPQGLDGVKGTDGVQGTNGIQL